MICMNSLKYTTDKKYKVVVIDEIETFLKKWCFNETLDGVQQLCYTNFINILKGADKIILLDAFITNILWSSGLSCNSLSGTLNFRVRCFLLLELTPELESSGFPCSSRKP